MTQSEINNIVWKACDSLRSSVDPNEYKAYVLVMLFVKDLSDVWNDKKAACQAKYGGEEERVQRALKNERFVVPEVSPSNTSSGTAANLMWPRSSTVDWTNWKSPTVPNSRTSSRAYPSLPTG